ncbi:ubiquinone/menaquinone biosynthesis methyltransferase [Candidatus Villigracilis saccharophilus]|uniref:ubiquinone/menaquinone biosynthesis methyltransferase n=1 Tax=Candidatus Villigracilis saccharophilus TaxID=3140684 RepID=UPI003136F02B|nr:ubiquinone/menaquinone biosynthesis methyltransferase [Anaerolineales bacterium]
MTNLTGQERSKYVQSMFTKIAHRYDLMNRLMTGGQDIRWRKQVIKLARLKPNASLLDLGTGTGDLAREALLQEPQAKVTAADFTIEMMRVGKKSGSLQFSAADALNLPFKDSTFDAVVSGFLMRNVTDIQQALKEQYRTLKSGGRIVILDTTRPKKNILSPFIWIHMHFIIPTIGGLLSGERDAYNYLPDTTENFLTAEQLAARMIAAGFKKVDFKRLMFGTIGMHWGEK